MDKRHELEKSIRLFEVTFEDAGRYSPIEILRLFAIGVRSEASSIANDIVRKRIDLELQILEAQASSKGCDEIERLRIEVKPLYEGVFSE